ncbi:hypothetical protein ACIOEW_40230 [Streptomyces sp. NPDC087901]|uniref:hypothetical protein n=1 Tax=Streptomyces sp. NPDC087901 TaxID=3365818 RepID=UPI003821A14B
MLMNHARKFAGIAVLIAGGTLLTACNPSAQEPGPASVKPTQEAVVGAASEQPGSREDGTVTGVLTYMAPGKLVVGSRPFWIAEDTEIWGAGEICGDPAGQVAGKCTVEELEQAAKTGKTMAEVEIVDGAATEIREQ